MWGEGVVLALERITKEDHELDGGVDGEDEIEIAPGELVDLVDDENGGLFQETAFPGCESP